MRRRIDGHSDSESFRDVIGGLALLTEQAELSISEYHGLLFHRSVVGRWCACCMCEVWMDGESACENIMVRQTMKLDLLLHVVLDVENVNLAGTSFYTLTSNFGSTLCHDATMNFRTHTRADRDQFSLTSLSWQMKTTQSHSRKHPQRHIPAPSA